MKRCGKLFLTKELYEGRCVCNVCARVAVAVGGAGEVGQSQAIEGVVPEGREFGPLLLALRRH